jgi:O-acetyl-ADP-ribose deacetylase (regulator of RNase III)
MPIKIVEGDLLDQDVDVIVNSWNRNIIPWWLLLPQGVSGAIKRKAGLQPFRELARFGPIPLGKAVVTSAGKLRFLAIIHVAGINMLWRASSYSIQESAKSGVAEATKLGARSIAFPIIGAGSGGFNSQRAEKILIEALTQSKSDLQIVVVKFKIQDRPN